MLKSDTHAHYLPKDWPDLAAKYGDRRFPVIHHGEDGHLLWGKPAPPQGLPQGLRGPLKAGKGDADHRRTGRFLGRRRPTFSRTSSMVAWATALARLAPSKRASIT